MQYEAYPDLTVTDDLSVINFVSEGKKGCIPKRIIFSPTKREEIYNLAFGDVDPDGEIDDHSISNNGDRNTILATVASTVKAYVQRFPKRSIFFTGSTPARTRLYRMVIGLSLKELAASFEIYAYTNEQLVPFAKNIEATAFLIRKKII